MAKCRGKQENAKALVTKHDITFFQETKLFDQENRFFKTFLPPGFVPHTSSHTKFSAGVAIITSPLLNELYHQKVIPLPPSLKGNALCVHFEAKNGTHSFRALNLYLDSHKSETRISQLGTLIDSLPSHSHLIVGGDFNFVEDKFEDSSSHSSHYDNSVKFNHTWSNNY